MRCKSRIRLEIEIGLGPIKAKFTKFEIGFVSSDWLNSNPISIFSLIRA